MIDLKTWLRGEGEEASRLLRPSDLKRCCLGFLGRACGIDDAYMFDKGGPVSVVASNEREKWPAELLGVHQYIGFVGTPPMPGADGDQRP